MTAIAATTVGQTDHTDRYIMGGYPYEQRGSRIVVIKLTGTTYTTGGVTLDLGRYWSPITAITAASSAAVTIAGTAPLSATPVAIVGSDSVPRIDGGCDLFPNEVTPSNPAALIATNTGSHTFTVPVTTTTAGTTGEVTWGLFRNRIWWIMPMTYTAKNATTGYLQMGFVPGAAKTDMPNGGYATSGWKMQLSAGSTEVAGSTNISAYTFYAVACGS